MWLRKAELQKEISDHQVCAVGSRLYILGGHVDNVEYYDTLTEQTTIYQPSPCLYSPGLGRHWLWAPISSWFPNKMHQMASIIFMCMTQKKISGLRGLVMMADY